MVPGDGLRPAALATTGSKSTNQERNNVVANSSSVPFIRRFNSILSSSAPNTDAIARCSPESLGQMKRNAVIRAGAVCLTVDPVALAKTSCR